MKIWGILIKYSDDDDLGDIMRFSRNYTTETAEEAIGKAYRDCKAENELCVYVHSILWGEIG